LDFNPGCGVGVQEMEMWSTGKNQGYMPPMWTDNKRENYEKNGHGWKERNRDI